ncbi:MAG: PorV/PorQ family protein, partial [Elusimicrobiota bacterium]|nr:PorV/PorQ family protein [Elusimicrobiota bacterium]
KIKNVMLNLFQHLFRPRNKFGVTLCVIFHFSFFIFHFAEGKGTGTTAGTTLLSAAGVRQRALGNCGAAVGGDIYSMFYNPALLADVSKKQLSTFFTTGLSDDYKASVVYGLPIPSRQKGGMAFGVFHLNGGEMEINYADGTSRNVVSESDYLLMLGWGGYWSKNASVGYNLKYLSTKLVEDYTASAIAFDAGIQLKSKNEKLKIGLSGQNYGTSLKYRSKAEPLPVLVRSGFSYIFSIAARHSLLAAIDGLYIIKEKDFYSSAGLEHSILDKYFLRGGIKIMPDRYDFTIGAGFKFYERYSLDWATELSELNNPHNVAFSVRF